MIKNATSDCIRDLKKAIVVQKHFETCSRCLEIATLVEPVLYDEQCSVYLSLIKE